MRRGPRQDEGPANSFIGEIDHGIESEAAISAPTNARHDIGNGGRRPPRTQMRYAPPRHVNGTVHHTRAEAERAAEHVTGQTTE